MTADAPPPIQRLESGELGRLEQRTTQTIIVKRLRDAILDGTLPMGSPLRETRLAAELGVSRAPLREALGILADEGIVDRIPFRGAFVAEVSQRTVDQIISMRARLEPYAIELSLPRLVPADGRDIVEAAIAEMYAGADAGDPIRTITAHMAFHSAFYQLADHEILLDIWKSWEARLQLFLSSDQRRFADLHDVAAAHERLLKVIDTHDLQAITHEVDVHLHGPLPGRDPG